ncbi:hypothetical protein C454_11126 [Haloferax gibbonsii ATCC 33959]|uniref:Uncharacterized protein n=1 Tax=Haloferax gibbonsii (strain ATCC 33959 / DSM 4427 / JCM 8863 / NBRC 102184 / NCIMB 2188 / Ma 2.38) TaxID=1227459 RepID=M0H6L9_HALGM|nr:hypothetical protein C454_11126 [Haloferax gibbonsii ATCC 33959]
MVQLIQSLLQFTIAAGLMLGALGFAVVGVMFIIGGLETRRRAKQYFKDIFIGTVILVAAPSIISFIISSMSGCGGSP